MAVAVHSSLARFGSALPSPDPGGSLPTSGGSGTLPDAKFSGLKLGGSPDLAPAAVPREAPPFLDAVNGERRCPLLCSSVFVMLVVTGWHLQFCSGWG